MVECANILRLEGLDEVPLDDGCEPWEKSFSPTPEFILEKNRWIWYLYTTAAAAAAILIANFFLFSARELLLLLLCARQAPFVATETFLFAGSLTSAPNLWAASFSFSFLKKRKIGFIFRHAEILKYIFISKKFIFLVKENEASFEILGNILFCRNESFKIRYLFNYGI
jgi:hypothetical protein